MIELWSWQLLSANKIRRICKGFEQAGETHPNVLRLARIGSDGEHVQNCRRDLERFIGKPILEEAMVTIQMPYKSELDTIVYEEFQILMPHLVFSCIYKASFSAFTRMFLGTGPSTLQDFWDQTDTHPSLVGHPIRDRHNYLSFAAPGGGADSETLDKDERTQVLNTLRSLPANAS